MRFNKNHLDHDFSEFDEFNPHLDFTFKCAKCNVKIFWIFVPDNESNYLDLDNKLEVLKLSCNEAIIKGLLE